jgi:hypothetical protein
MINVARTRVLVVLPAVFVLLTYANGAAASKTHIITFGKWNTVPWVLDSGAHTVGDKPLNLKVRPLLVDARVKEFTLGLPHDVTDRLFVVQRAFRVNDSLPQESALPPHWQWQRGGWLLVDRVTGHISAINLPEFDATYSAVNWYRDYAAYCGISDDSKQLYAVVAQVNRRKPIVKWLIGETKFAVENQESHVPDLDCKLPDWQRDPARVTFEPNPTAKRTYVIHGHAVDLLADEKEDKEDEEALK